MKTYTQQEYTEGICAAFAAGLSVSIVVWVVIRVAESVIIGLGL